MPTLEVRNLTVQFHGLKAVDDLSLSVRDGEVFAIIGPNGAGKTTLLNAITSLVPITSGKVIYNEVDITRRQPSALAPLGISRTFQKRSVFPGLTVEENVITGLHLRIRSRNLLQAVLGSEIQRQRRQALEHCAEILRFLGLEPWRHHKAETLPYGKQRLLAIGIALAPEPQLLLLDEPVAGMNPKEAEEMVELFSRLRQRVRNIILVEHHMRVVMKVADRVQVVNFGRHLALGTPQEVQENPEVIAAYLGREVAALG